MATLHYKKQLYSHWLVTTNRVIGWLCVVTFLTLANAALAEDWPFYRGNTQGVGVAQGQLADTFQLAWTFPTDDAIKSSPIVVKGVVYVGSNDSHVYAIEGKDGTEIWDTKVEGAVEAPPMFANGMIYIGTMQGFVQALDAGTGKEIWRFETDGQISDTVVPATIGSRPVVLFGSYDNHLHCLDARTGEPVWSFGTDGYVSGSPVIDGDRVIFGGCDGLLYQLRLDNGHRISKAEIGGEVGRMPTLHHGVAIVGHYQNAVTAIDLKLNAVAWTFADRDFPYVSSASVKNGKLVIGSRARRVYCLDVDTGKEQWAFRTRGAVDGSPVIADGRAVFGSADGKLYLVSIETGKQVWAYDVGASIAASPAVAHGWIVVAAEDGSVYAFEPVKADK